MAEEEAEAERREALLGDVFAVLDQKRRGFISRVELAHILDAMLADSSVSFSLPEALTPTDNMKDSRVTLADLRKHLVELTVADLEDVRWFAESVVKVETELREVWRKAVEGWRQRVEVLYKRNLHRYLLSSQPERVSRWLLLRTSMDEVATKDDSSTGLLGLGISQQEVEVLFTDETADDINRCSDKIEPFLTALELRSQLYEVALEGDTSRDCPADVAERVAEVLTKLVELAERSRELACLLIHEDTLRFATAVARSAAFAQTVVAEVSRLIMTLISYRVHENARDYERLCRQRLAEYLEIDFDVEGFKLEAERRSLNAKPKTGRTALAQEWGSQDGEAAPRAETIAEWVGCLLTLSIDFDRGEMLDVLIKYDEKRLALVSEGGDRPDETAPIAVSLFSFGRTVPHLISRLDVSSHHALHEHRTPMRTHLWKFLLNVLASAGERGRALFRAAEGARVVCHVIRGNAWGVERDELSPEEEDDREEEAELYQPSLAGWGVRDPFHSWPYVECFEDAREGERRFYAMDFLDDKFYGSKDRMLAAALLEYMSSEAMWGEEALVDELMQYPNSLQVLCRVRPPCCFLARLLLTSPNFPAYLESTAQAIAQGYAQRSMQGLIDADATCHSLFPVTTFSTGRVQAQGRAEVIEAFRREVEAVEKQNVVLRILGHAYHNLQACLQEERSLREAEPNQGKSAAPGHEEPQEEASQLEGEITECCKLLAGQIPLSVEEIGDTAVAVYMQVKEFTRKALLSVNQLPPVNADERQKARGLESAKTVPPRPMYFGHYQNLIYNQSNAAQPSSRSVAFEGEARAKCLQGSANILFTGENRYLSEPSLFPYEFLVTLRLLQLVRLRETSVPAFIVELQDLLEQLTGQRSSFVFSETREDMELAGAEYPWRTGLAPLETFRVAQVPLRRSELRRYPRNSPLAVVRGLEAVLREYAGLSLWEEDADGPAAAPGSAERTEALSARRSVLLALVFNHLCYFQPKTVTLEDSAQGLSLRLGATLELLAAVKELLAEHEDLEAGADFADAKLPEASFRVFHGSPGRAVTVLQVSAGDKKVAFTCMMNVWTLWANCAKDNAQVLTECSNVQRYFSFDA